MGIITNIRYGLRLKNAFVVWEAVKKIINWPAYFADFFSLSRGKYTIFYMRNGLKYLVRSRTCDRAIITTTHLVDQYNLSQLTLSRDSIIIDIGAHIGTFSVLVSNKASSIFAYEPVLENYKILEENIKINNLENKIKAFNCIVTERNGKLKIYISRMGTSMHSVYKKKNDSDFIEVASISLKYIFDDNKINKCSLLKIDAEGAEYEMLYGLPPDYFARIEKIYLEYHDMKVENRQYNGIALERFLSDNGYRVTKKDTILFAEK